MIVLKENHPQALRAAANSLYHDGRRPLLAMFANDERKLNGGYAVYCVFGEMETQRMKVLKTVVKDDGSLEFPSLTPIIPGAAWYEREIHDLFGLVPKGHPDLRRLVLHENWPEGYYPMRKDFDIETLPEAGGNFPIPQVEGEGVFEVPVGPIHAGIIEPGHFRFSQAGENIINLEAKLFFTHRGIEKGVEGLPIERAFFQVERICGVCTVSHALSYAQAVETMAGAQIPLRAQYIRTLTAELERLYNHIGDIGNLCAGVGFAVGISHGSRLKEKLMRLNEILAGNRFLRGIIALGGVNLDVTAGIAGQVIAVLQELEPDFKELVDILRESDAFLDRVNTTGIVPHKAAFDLGLVGPAARASGINADMRRDYPYLIYNRLHFKVPVYSEGDVAARLWVRADEALQSISLIRQILADLPPGPLKTDIPLIEPYSIGIGWSESARGGNLHWLMTGENNTVFRLFVRSASYPNWPALAVAAPGNIIPDFPLINKSFELCYACLDR